MNHSRAFVTAPEKDSIHVSNSRANPSFSEVVQPFSVSSPRLEALEGRSDRWRWLRRRCASEADTENHD
jgi:hypothetical protein